MSKITKYDRDQRKLGADLWRSIRDDILARLCPDDDPALWEFALTMILGRTRTDASRYTGEEAMLVEIGCCSHWIRPKWKTDSGMTWPFGYNPTTFNLGGWSGNFRSLPRLDWSFKWQLDAVSGSLSPGHGQPTRRPLCHRICLPARTLRHPQATAHTIWTPGWPRNPKQKWTLLCGFKRTDGRWRCFTRWEGERASKES